MLVKSVTMNEIKPSSFKHYCKQPSFYRFSAGSHCLVNTETDLHSNLGKRIYTNFINTHWGIVPAHQQWIKKLVTNENTWTVYCRCTTNLRITAVVTERSCSATYRIWNSSSLALRQRNHLFARCITLCDL